MQTVLDHRAEFCFFSCCSCCCNMHSILVELVCACVAVCIAHACMECGALWSHVTQLMRQGCKLENRKIDRLHGNI